MKDYEKMKGIVGIIDDGIKDACMECDWAREAVKNGDKETATMLYSEAMKRASSAKEWMDKHRAMMLDPEHAEEMAEAFVKRLDDKIAHAMAKISEMKM